MPYANGKCAKGEGDTLVSLVANDGLLMVAVAIYVCLLLGAVFACANCLYGTWEPVMYVMPY